MRAKVKDTMMDHEFTKQKDTVAANPLIHIYNYVRGAAHVCKVCGLLCSGAHLETHYSSHFSDRANKNRKEIESESK